ncbi:jg1626 [Pararge aegeria aegeria]|uniref:Jg1626 protein n=1 Tax=Pararge aegeria aegeria TaxID=348720 RepID=A0A8S4RBE0_9NEOP|nr:jg1626 [Pararge aegeria aegeria]
MAPQKSCIALAKCSRRMPIYTSSKNECPPGGTLGSTSLTLPPDVVEPWGSSHGELSRSPHSPGDAVATPQVVIGKCP